MSEDSDYLTVEEFAALPSDAQHAVQSAGDSTGVIKAGGNGGIRRYSRAQVDGLLATTT